jgi:hypothetical protein
MYENLMEQIVSQENATVAWEAVKRNQGAPGIDRMTVDAIRPCGQVRPLRSTAVCGKPHVRWCGRGGGRNPATSTRSRNRGFRRRDADGGDSENNIVLAR